MWLVPQYILVLGTTIAVDYWAGLQIEKSTGRQKKLYLVFSITFTCLILFIFKYFNFFNENLSALAGFLHWKYSISALRLALPLGLSFHTFQSLSYVIEVFRGNQKTEKNFGIYALYVMFFPQLAAGPIERPQNLLHQFREVHQFDMERMGEGLQQMLWGLFKKVVLADRLAVYVSVAYNHPEKHNWPTIFLGVIFFAFQIYFDFSGYSDIAIGAAKVLGFRLMTNFDRPFAARNVTEFWRRWHISLYTWFNDYLFTPLVVNWRAWGKPGIMLALLVTFLVSGLWHGANWTYIIWGGLHGLALIYEFATRRQRRIWAEKLPGLLYNTLSIVCMFAFSCLSWIFFRAESVSQALTVFRKLFTDIDPHSMPFSAFIETKYDLVVISLLVPALLVLEAIYGRNPLVALSSKKPAYTKWAVAWICIFLILNFGAYKDPHHFIYFQF